MKFVFMKPAEKYLLKLEFQLMEKIMYAIHCLPEGEVKPLRGKDHFFRLRVGDYRVVFVIDGETVIIRDVGPRGDIYKKIG